MRKNPATGTKRLGGNKYHAGRLAQSLGPNQGRNIIVGIRAALRTLQSRVALCVHLIFASTPGNSDSEEGDRTREMVEGSISDAVKNLWVLTNYEAAINPLNGGRFQHYQQNHLRGPNARQCQEVQAHAK